MCGIAGAIGADAGRLEGAVRRMVVALGPRGPDGAGIANFTLPGERRSAVFGHTRLAILDVSEAAHQPMLHPETGSLLVYNGEIYNYAALRAELESRGHRFRSSGDTEVLLRLLVEEGAAALPRLRGMYAFAFWDARRGEVLLGRDPFGIKPLLLAHTRDGCVFGSQLDAIRAAQLVDLTLDRNAVHDFLTYGMVLEPATIVREVRSVPPGHVVRVAADGSVGAPEAVQSLGDFESSADDRAPDVRQVCAVVQDAVTCHLASDVPVGVLLSGGVDSTVLAAAARAAGRAREVRLLTIGFREPDFSEEDTARATARTLGLRHDVLVLEPAEVLAALDDALAAMDQPTVDGVNSFIITRLARRHGITVLLSGLGGDEVFGGYTTFRKAPLLACAGRLLAPGARAVASFERAPRLARQLAAFRGGSDLSKAYFLQRSIRPERVALADAASGTGNQGAAGDTYHRIARLEMAHYMRNQILRDADTFGGANGVELRVPFVDREVLRCAFALSGADHVGWIGPKKRVLRAVLRELAPGVRLPSAKRGFLFPWARWLRDELRPVVRDTLATADCLDDAGITRRAARAEFERFLAGAPAVTWAEPWSTFVLARWLMRTGIRGATG